jgi:hypothetical protein
MADEKLEDYAAESLDLSEWVPSTPSLAAVEVEAEAPVETAGFELEEAALDLDLGDLEQALGRTDAEVQPTPRHAAADQDLEFDPHTFDIDLSSLPEEGAALVVADESNMLSLDDDEPLLADVELPQGQVKFSSFSEDEVVLSEGMDDDVAALAAQLDAYEANDQRQAAKEPDFASSFSAPAPAAAPGRTEPDAPAARSGGFGALELIPMDAEIDAGHADADDPSTGELAPASRRGPGLSLADAESVHEAMINKGALLVFAGLGGPDAVRQVLSALPPTLPVPVLLYQHLDTGKHDRLVGQLAKASKLPLDLAVEGKLAFSGRVAVLPPGVGIRHGEGNFTFIPADDLSSLVSALPAADSVVLMLSGAAPSVVPAVRALQAAGAQVLAQTPASCFDATAAEAVLAAGAQAGEPPDLARMVIERWS